MSKLSSSCMTMTSSSSLSDAAIPKTATDKSVFLKTSPSRKSLDCELYGLGTTLRHLAPIGGRESGIFDAYRRPSTAPEKRHRTKDYMKSQIFGGPENSPPRPMTPVKDTTYYKLFARSPLRFRKLHSKTFEKSNIFSTEPVPRKYVEYRAKNPITGEACTSRDVDRKPMTPIKRNPITFEGVPMKIVQSRCKLPPGGLSTVSLDYIEEPDWAL